MRPCSLFAASMAATLLLTAVGPSLAQSQLPRPTQLPPAGGGAAPPPAAAKPYKAVTISAPEPVKDVTFEAFRKQLGTIAANKDRRALAGMVAQNFFWMGEKGDRADKKKSGIDNLAKAIGLDGKDAQGWDMLAAAAEDPTGMPFPDRKDTLCAPADPVFNAQELAALAKSTGTDEGEWAYPTQPGLEVRSGPQPNAPVIEKLGMHFVRVMPDSGPGNQPGNQQSPALRVMTPAGKTGFVPADALSPLGSDQICYSKEGAGWKISGFLGGES